MGQYHESPTSIGNQPHPTEPAPPLPKLNNHAETINSDVANSSSNSSSHGASTSSGSDFGWMRHYQSLVEYKQREGTCEVPQKYKHGSLNLGVWVNKVSSIVLLTTFHEHKTLSCWSWLNRAIVSNEWREGNSTMARDLLWVLIDFINSIPSASTGARKRWV